MLSLAVSRSSRTILRLTHSTEVKKPLESSKLVSKTGSRTGLLKTSRLSSLYRSYGTQYIEPVKKSKRPVGPENRVVLTLPEGAERVANVEAGISKSWTNLGLHNEQVQQAIAELGFNSPTPIQQLVIPELVQENTQNLVFADQTGTGKTLAYLLPIIQSLKEDEIRNGRNDLPGRPRAIVLVPNRELAEQVLKIAKKIFHVVKLRAASFSGGSTVSKQRQNFESPIDLLVATPGRLLQHYDRKRIFFSKVKNVVFDEADMLLDASDGGFARDCYRVVDAIRHRTEATRYVFCVNFVPKFMNLSNFIRLHSEFARFVLCGATITQVLTREIDNPFPNAKHILSPTLHKSVAKLEQKWITVTADRLAKLKELLFEEYPRASSRQKQSQSSLEGESGSKKSLKTKASSGTSTASTPKETKRTIIFCNTISSCRFLDHELREVGFNTTSYHGDIPVDQRPVNFRKFADGEVPIIVCTDVASRGLDFASVDHVILFDFPLNSVDYLHRIGRTARGGKQGHVTNFIMKRDFVLAEAIQEALKKGLPLDGLSSSAAENPKSSL